MDVIHWLKQIFLLLECFIIRVSFSNWTPISSSFTHTHTIIQTEHVICRNLYVYTHKHSITIVKKKEAMNVEESGQGHIGKVCREEREGRNGITIPKIRLKKNMKRTWIFESCMFLQEDVGDPQVHHELSLEKDCSRRYFLVSMYPFSAILFFLRCILPAQLSF